MVDPRELLFRPPDPLSDAVKLFWTARGSQAELQRERGNSDQGARGAVTGGRQMDGFIEFVRSIVLEAGIAPTCIHYEKQLELPGFFRPTKEWDLLVLIDGVLAMALEAKSQVGPSFGNNFNNRTEEAMGSATDIWTAFREGAFSSSPRPWLGYMFILEDCKGSTSPVKVKEPHFPVLPEFVGASYMKRYELFCRKLVRERLYDAAVFVTSRSDTGLNGDYNAPAKDLSAHNFARSLKAHLSQYK